MPLVGFERYLDADDELPPQPYFATCWLDPWGFLLEAVCHHDRI